MGNKYCFIISSSLDYLEALVALINSIDATNPGNDIIILNYNIPVEFFDEFSPLLHNTKLKIVDSIDKEDQKVATIIERYSTVVQYADQYDAVCLLDADMVMLNDISLFFDIASKGFIVTGSNGSLLGFDKNVQKLYKCPLKTKEYLYTKTHSSVPIFVSAEHTQWFEDVAKSWKHGLCDFTYLNIQGIKNNLPSKMLCMPPYSFTGVHHWLMKPETAIIEKITEFGKIIVSGTEEIIYSLHGKLWSSDWMDCQKQIMYNYLKDWDMGPKCKEMVDNSADIMMRLFNYYLTINGDFYIKYQ